MDTKHPKASHRPPRRESGVIQRVRASLRRSWTESSTPSVLIACSGGQDSVVLAHLLLGLERTQTIRAEFVHVDHGVRDDSAHAAQVVMNFGASLGLPVHIVRLTDEAIADHAGAGAEEALRRERYRAFADIAAQTGADLLALAHHQRDQAETVLLHLIRGAGLHGASGMRECSVVEVPWWEPTRSITSLRLWRPLLAESAETIAEWHQLHGLPVAEDATNEDRKYRRNAVRHDVLPELETIFTGAVANLARFADLASEDDDYLEQQAAERVLAQPDGDLHRRAIIDTDIAIQRRVVRQWIIASDYDGDLTSDRIDAVRALAERNRSGARVEIGAGWSVEISGGVLSLRS
jgi:tRNA(Ile)-lysidine synthase